MGYEYLIWKWKDGPRDLSGQIVPRLGRRPGLIYLLLGQELPCEEIDQLDLDRLSSAVDQAFPGWQGDRFDEYAFNCCLGPDSISLTFYTDTPERVAEWFNDFFQREGLFVFDPQRDKITGQDEMDFRRIKAKARRVERASRLKEELQELLKRAEAGDAQAQSELGNSYSSGEGAPKDLALAFQWYERSAGQGNHCGQYNLADCYRRGEGVPKDIHKAIYWLEKSAEKDKTIATFELGEIFAKGEGVSVDKEKARQYYEIALAHQHPGARKAIRTLDEPETSNVS